MKEFICLILVSFLLFSFTSTGQDSLVQHTFKGTVVSKDKPLPGVSIFVEGKRKGIITDEHGNFLFTDTSSRRLKLHFSAIGHQHFVKEIFLSADNSEPDTIELHEATNALDDVVVSGTMKAVSKMDSPIPVEVYSPVLFKKNPTPNIFESLAMVNGVQPQLNCNVCNTGDIHINGMEGPYTMILIDGMPIVSSLSTVYGLSGIPNSLVKRIEVVKGPASTLYGSEAVGGLINIITKDPLTADKLKLDFSATSIGEYNTDVTAKFKAGTASSVLGLNYFNFWNRRDINHDNFTDVTLQNRFSIFNKWHFARTNNRAATLAARYVYENRWGGEMQWNKNFRGSDSVYGESIYTNRIEVIGNYQLNKDLYVDISYNYHLQDSYYGRVKYLAKQHVAFSQLRWSSTLGKHGLLVGLPIRFTSYDDNSPATVKDGINYPSNTFLPGIFILDEIKANNKFTTLVGLRYDRNNEHGSIFTPRLSFKYSPDRNNTIRLSSGNGYRVVNLFTEDHAALTGSREVVIAEKLKPEQSWNANLNYTRQITLNNGLITLDGSAFYTYFLNKIIADFLTDPNKLIYNNLTGHAISKGLTLNADVSFIKGIKMNAGITMMDVYEVDKDSANNTLKIPQLFAPKFSGTYAISYSFYKTGLSIDWTGKINGPMHLPVVPNDFRPSKSPFFCIMNLQLTKTFKGGFELYGGAKNLLNFLPKHPLLHPDDPFDEPGGKYFDENSNPRPTTNPHGYTFDPTYNYAPIQGVKGFVGFRWTVK